MADIARSGALPRIFLQLRVDWVAAAAVGLAVLVGAVVRAWALGAVGFNSDEAVYAGQAAALAGAGDYGTFFAIFRAHPLLVQFLLSGVFSIGVSDVAARLLSVIIGLLAIPLVYLLGTLLYSRWIGVVAAAVLALLPYHIAVTRQVLLDGPETTLFLLSMLLLAQYAATSRSRYLYVAAFAAGLTFLAKETAILVLPVAGAFILMTPRVVLGWRRVAIALGLLVVSVSPYPISILVSGASDTARSFLVWQLLRRPNHSFTFYAELLPGTLGPVLLVLAIVGIVIAVRRASWQDRLLLSWVLVPLIFYQLWPVKGYQYLLPIVPAVLLLAVRAIAGMAADVATRLEVAGQPRVAVLRAATGGILSAILLASVAFPAFAALGLGGAAGSLAGTGGLPGGREAGQWIDDHVPEGADFMTIGPTLSNLIQFYGHRHSRGLSVSANPLHRNPAYDPIENPDSEIRTLRIQYLAWDIWSSSRSKFFERVLMRYVAKYHGELIYEQHATVRRADGTQGVETVVKVYEVRP